MNRIWLWLGVVCVSAVAPMGHTAPFYEDRLTTMTYKDEAGALQSVTSLDDWKTRRKHIIENMQEVMGSMPGDEKKVPLDPQYGEAKDCGAYVQKHLTIGVEANDRLPVYLLIPKKVDGKTPGMLCLHQTVEIGKSEPIGLGGNENLRYAKELATRGYVCVAPDYPNFGEYKVDAYAMGYASATMKGIWNHMRCVDFLQSLPEVDPERIGAIGHSLGGHNTLYVGTFDERIKAMVTSCGFNSFPKYYGGDLTGWSHKGYMPRIAETYERNPARMPFNFTEVLSALAPRAVFVNAPIGDANFEITGVYDCLRAAKPVYALHGASGNLVSEHPDCEHDFPPVVRQNAYRFLDTQLRRDLPHFAVAPFSADITIPMGHACMGGGISPSKEVVDNLMANGIAILGEEKPFVLCSLDWCEVRNDAFDYWRAVLAEAAGTSMERVIVSSVHQHDAPVADFEAQRLLDEQGLYKSLCDSEFVRSAALRTAAALKKSLEHPKPVTHYGTGEAEVREVTSNRRVLNAEGNVTYDRGSATRDASIRDKPAGVVDPWMKSLSFWNGGTPVAVISSFALHPMSYYGKGGVSKDFPGHARERLRAENPDVHQIYFSGCSGDVTAGKWNDGAAENRAVLADKMYQAMAAAWKNSQRYPIEQIVFRCPDLMLPPRLTDEYAPDAARNTLRDASKKTFDRNLAAMALSFQKRFAKGQPIDVPCMDFGRAQFLLMPAESFVEYQLKAQDIRPESVVLVAGYGECGPGYIPTQNCDDDAFTDKWLWVARGNEPLMRQAMERALGR
jgi:pimeloyl-ACP methyl ester carboxylesterase